MSSCDRFEGRENAYICCKGMRPYVSICRVGEYIYLKYIVSVWRVREYVCLFIGCENILKYSSTNTKSAVSWVLNMNESCHTREYVTPHIYMSHSHTWMHHVTHMTESRHTHMNESLTHMIESNLRRTGVKWLFQVCNVTRCNVWRYSYMRATWLVYVHAVTRSCVWRDSCVCVTWLVHVCDV